MNTNERTSVVVGGGITGASTAYSLAKRGATDVVLLEKEHLGAGSTGKSAGVIETQFLDEFDVEMRARSVETFDRLDAESHVSFERVGYIRLLMDPAERAAFEESVRVQHRHGIDDARFLEPDELADVVPDMDVDGVHGALYGPSDGYADPYTVTQVLAERAGELGVDVRTGVAATDVVTAGDEVVGVETTDGTIDCSAVVNAAGPWAPQFAARAGLDLPAAPYRRQLLIVEPDDPGALDYRVPMVMEYTPAGKKPGLYFRDEGGDQLLVGLHVEASTDEDPADPDRYDGSYDESFALDVFDALSHRAPRFADFRVTNGWAGIYTITPDTEPILDEHPGLAGYFVAAGFSGKGFQLGPVVGEVMADLVLDGRPRTVSDLSPAALDRF